MTTRVCSVCGELEGPGESECRPYGKGGALVCFTCGMQDILTTQSEYGRRLEQAVAKGRGVVFTKQGPIAAGLRRKSKR